MSFIRIILLCLCACAVEAQEWRILALRVDFPLEDPDEFTTTGQGQFDLRSSEQASEDYALPYDIPPHDRVYFESHLEALRRYYDVVSEGKVEIGYDVFPRENEAAYTLPNSMLRYGNGRSSEEIGERWIDLLRAALELAQADTDGPDLSVYNSFLVFHAGVGHETGELNDIRSVFLQQSDFARFADGPLRVGGVEIDRAWILPESPSLRGRGGLNGLLAKFFGNQLGLPGLSNFADGLPAVGGWSLMDVGANALGFVRRDSLDAVVGFAPPHPMAWSKIALGWVEPLVVRRDTVVSILASDRSGTLPKVVRVPIDNDEYFLLENRQQRGRRGAPDDIDVFGADADEVVWIDEGQVDLSAGGVWLGVDEYDAFIPGSGILVWHVDEGVIAVAGDEGAFNNRPEQQGIALEEADGYRDIGNPVFERLRQIEGSPDDPFYVGGQTLFGPNSQPNTRSNEGWTTGIEIEVLSELGDEMQVAIRFLRSAPGWPLAIEGGRRLQAMDVDGDGDVEMVGGVDAGVFYKGYREAEQWVTADGLLLAVGDADDDGAAEFFVYDRKNNAVAALERDGELLWRQAPGDNIVAALFSAHSALAIRPLLVVATADQLYVLDAANGDEIQRQEIPAIRGIAAADTDGDGLDELVITADGGLRVLSATGLHTWWDGSGQTVLAPASGDVDGDGRAEIVFSDELGTMRLLDIDGERFAQALADSVDVAPTLGDLDGDGLLEIAQITASRTIHVLRESGLDQANFPAALPRFSEAGALRYEPLFADVDGDGAQEIWLGAEHGIYALDDKAQLVDGEPFLTASPLRFAPAIFDGDGDGQWELAALDGEAFYLWSTRGVGGIGWGQAGAAASGQRKAGPTAGAQTPRENALLPAHRAYCYPNPVREGERAHVRFYLAEAAAVELVVFDALGARIERIRAQAQAGDNELAWSVDGYDSGLYIGRIEAKSASAKSQLLIKMAVSR